jgi:hypothetical protein
MATKTTNYLPYLRLGAVFLPAASLVNTLFPGYLKGFINKNLRVMGALQGSIDSLNITTGGKITIKGMRFTGQEEQLPVPFKYGEVLSIVVNLSKRQLWKGTIEANVKVDDVVVYFIKKEDGVHSVFHSLGSSTPPFTVNIPDLKVSNVQVHYLDATVRPGVELKTDRLNLTAANLSTLPLYGSALPAHIKIDCSACSGNIDIDIKGDFAQPSPAFDLNAEIKNVDLTRLNSLFLSYAGFDVNKGALNLFVEAAAVNGQFKGYLKPAIVGLDILNRDDLKKGVLKVLWEGMLGAALTMFTNPFKKDLATKIPFSGSLQKPDVNVGYAVFQILYNAFVQSLRLSIDNEITQDSVKSVE